MNRLKSRWALVGIGLSLLLIGAVACGLPSIGGPTPTPTTSPMEARAGEWSGTTEFGSFTFTVSPDGSAITDFSLNYSAGIASGSVSPQSPVEIPIEEDGSFDLSIPDAGVQFRGQFSEDGTRVSGYWEMDIPLAGTFSEEWELER